MPKRDPQSERRSLLKKRKRLMSGRGKIGQWYQPLEVWREYCASTLTGTAVPSGHYIAEEAPAETLAEFEKFFA